MKMTKKTKTMIGIGGVAALAYYFLVYRKKPAAVPAQIATTTASSGVGYLGSLGSDGLGSLGGGSLGSLG